MGMPIIVGSNIKREQAITDIIESIALEETALSHILNAEGETIQAIVHSSGVTSQQLLCVNKSVQAMVKSITNLEMILKSKLELFDGCICDCHDDCKGFDVPITSV